jgi:hypothetical protein
MAAAAYDGQVGARKEKDEEARKKMKRAPGLIYKGEEISDRAVASILGGSFFNNR